MHSLLALDIMGDFAFSGLFNNMRAGADTTHTRHGIEEAIATGEALGTIPWTRALVLKLSNTKNNAALEMARAVAEKRKAQGARTRDLFYYLVSFVLRIALRRLTALQLDEDGEGGHPPMSTTTLAHESMLAMGAGSGTTSAALSNALFYLLTVPGAFGKLRTELDAVAGNASFDVSFKAAQLTDLPFLNGVM
jgi:cytochrome P450